MALAGTEVWRACPAVLDWMGLTTTAVKDSLKRLFLVEHLAVSCSGCQPDAVRSRRGGAMLCSACHKAEIGELGGAIDWGRTEHGR